MLNSALHKFKCVAVYFFMAAVFLPQAYQVVHDIVHLLFVTLPRFVFRLVEGLLVLVSALAGHSRVWLFWMVPRC